MLCTKIKWHPHIHPNYTHTFFHSDTDNNLYQTIPEGYLVYFPKTKTDHQHTQSYHTSTQLSFPDSSIIASLHAVEVIHEPKQIRIIGPTSIDSHGTGHDTQTISTLNGLYDKLPTSLKHLCGKVHLPPDGGTMLMNYINETSTPIIGAADASLKDGNCSHA